jgi:hypothetical protein
MPFLPAHDFPLGVQANPRGHGYFEQMDAAAKEDEADEGQRPGLEQTGPRSVQEVEAGQKHVKAEADK